MCLGELPQLSAPNLTDRRVLTRPRTLHTAGMLTRLGTYLQIECIRVWWPN